MISIQDFQSTSLTLGETKTVPSGGCYTPLLIDGQSVKLQVCSAEGMRAPFGVNDSYSGGETQTMPLVPTPEFEVFANEIDALVPVLVEPRSTELFGEKKSLSQLKDMYKHLVHLSKNQEHDNTVHVKIRPKTLIDIATCDGYVKGTTEDIVRGARVLVVVRLGSVWQQENKTFGVTLEAVRVLAHLPPKRVRVEDVFPVRPSLPTR